MQANDNKNNSIPLDTLLALRAAAIHSLPVAGLTHRFYRYPARFSPVFVASAIEAFSKPGQIVLDPYMGGGTTIVEALARGRKTVGCDLNSLAVFVAKAKTTLLSEHDRALVSAWAYETVTAVFSHVVPRHRSRTAEYGAVLKRFQSRSSRDKSAISWHPYFVPPLAS